MCRPLERLVFNLNEIKMGDRCRVLSRAVAWRFMLCSDAADHSGKTMCCSGTSTESRRPARRYLQGSRQERWLGPGANRAHGENPSEWDIFKHWANKICRKIG